MNFLPKRRLDESVSLGHACEISVVDDSHKTAQLSSQHRNYYQLAGKIHRAYQWVMGQERVRFEGTSIWRNLGQIFTFAGSDAPKRDLLGVGVEIKDSSRLVTASRFRGACGLEIDDCQANYWRLLYPPRDPMVLPIMA
jgi:hypothetical protein